MPLSFSERDGGMSERIRAIAAAMQGAKFDVNASEKIVQDIWDKWVFLATLAGATCLFRGSVGDILAAPQGAERMLDLLEGVPRRRKRQRLCAARRRQRTHTQDPHHGQLAHGVDAARHRKQREDRSRPYHR